MSANRAKVPPSASQSSSSSTSKPITFEHTWTIEEFVSLCGDEIVNFPVLFSGQFMAPADRITTPDKKPVMFELKLYPKGCDAECRDFVSAFVKLNNHSGLLVGVWFSIVDAKGEKNLRFSSIQTYTIPGSNIWGEPEMISRAELLNQANGYLHNGKLVVHCKLSIIQAKLTGLTLSEQLADKLTNQTVPMDKLIANLLDSGAHSDVTLVLVDDGGQELRAHKLILMARSRVFADMFESKLDESNRVEIGETRVEAFKQVLHFIYTGTVGTSLDDIAQDLLICADKYQLDPLKSICEEYLAGSISFESDLLELHKMAKSRNAPKLEAKVLDLMHIDSASYTTCMMNSIRKSVQMKRPLISLETVPNTIKKSKSN